MWSLIYRHKIELRHTTGDGAVIELKVTPVEATKIRERDRLRIAQMEAAYRAALPPPASRHLLATPEQTIENASGHALVHGRDLLRALIHCDWVGDAGNPGVEALIVKLATTLWDAGLNHVLVSLAAELEASGHPVLGRRLRREATD